MPQINVFVYFSSRTPLKNCPAKCFLSNLFFMKIYIKIKKYLRENNHNYKNVTIALFCHQNDLIINTTELWCKKKCH